MDINTKPLFSDEEDDNEIDITKVNRNIVTQESFETFIDPDSDDSSEYQHFGKFSVNEDWVSKYNEEIRTPHESYELKLLREDMYTVFVNSTFFEKYEKIKKVPKQDMLKIFLYFNDNVDVKNRYTSVEKFLEIADFMNMNYETLYKELPMIYKQNLIAELDKKYKIFNKRKVHKLF
jgi:hypothetical protein